jgi:hypothetical protein
MTKTYNGVQVVLNGQLIGQVTAWSRLSTDVDPPLLEQVFSLNQLSYGRHVDSVPRPHDLPRQEPVLRREVQPCTTSAKVKAMWWDGPDFFVEEQDGKVWCYHDAYVTAVQPGGYTTEGGEVVISEVSFVGEAEKEPDR